MRRDKKIISCILAAGLMLSVTACGNDQYGASQKGVVNPDVSQTQFSIMGGMSALSKGYDNNEVLNQLEKDTGFNIDWTVMSDSLAEQVNIRIAGGELPISVCH